MAYSSSILDILSAVYFLKCFFFLKNRFADVNITCGHANWEPTDQLDKPILESIQSFSAHLWVSELYVIHILIFNWISYAQKVFGHS